MGVVGPNTTVPSYWLNWRFLLCAIWVFIAIVFSILLLWKYERRRSKCKSQSNRDQQEAEAEAATCVYEDEIWGTCSKSINLFWLLAYRILCFSLLLTILVMKIIHNNGYLHLYYTYWTFTLVTVYFGIAASLSIQGCLRYHRDGEQNMSNCKTAASGWGYAMQIIFQICAGAVILVDTAYWVLLYPQLKPGGKPHFLDVCVHSLNVVVVLGDAILNSLRFPFFRVGYFILYTCVFIIYQWIYHACVHIKWPYPFLELASTYAPLWYFGVGLMQVPCYGFFALVFWIKGRLSNGNQQSLPTHSTCQ